MVKIRLCHGRDVWRLYGVCIVLFLFAMTTTACSSLQRLRGKVAGELAFEPYALPIEITANTWGEIGFRVTPDVALPTPIGVFKVGLITDSSHLIAATDNILVVRIDDQECVYDLHGQKLDINFSTGNFRTVALRTDESNNVYVELEGEGYTGCSQNWTKVATSGAAVLSGNDLNCPGASPSYLAVGQTAYISIFQAAVHETPSELAPLAPHKYLGGGRVVSVIDGPICGAGNPGHVLFWKIRSEVITFSDGTSGVVEGWVAEESGDVYLLRPVEGRT